MRLIQRITMSLGLMLLLSEGARAAERTLPKPLVLREMCCFLTPKAVYIPGVTKDGENIVDLDSLGQHDPQTHTFAFSTLFYKAPDFLTIIGLFLQNQLTGSGDQEPLASPAFSPLENNGIIYTRQGGFLDVSHMRTVSDYAKLVYQALLTHHQEGDEILTIRGRARLKRAVAPENFVDLAAAVAWQDFVGHEIASYGANIWNLNRLEKMMIAKALKVKVSSVADRFSPGHHNSSFSPEDLPSNRAGVELFQRVMRRHANPEWGESYFGAVTIELKLLLQELGAVAASETEKRFEEIAGDWVLLSGEIPGLNAELLRKRNFTAIPWLLDADVEIAPLFFDDGFLELSSGQYEFTAKEKGKTLYFEDYPAHIEAIKQANP